MDQPKLIPKYVEVKEVSDTVGLYRVLIQVQNTLNNIYLSHPQTTLLAYYACHGITKSTENMFCDNEKISSSQIISNLKFALKKNGMIFKNPITNLWETLPFLHLRLEDMVAVILKIEVK